MGDFEAAFKKTDSFWDNFEENLCENWNQIDADVVKNLFENYTNRLLDVTKTESVMTRY